MKIAASFLAPLAVYLGLPASFVATAMHEPAALAASSASPFLQNAGWMLPLLFVSTVMSIATILVHHLREEQRLQTFATLHLRLSAADAVSLPAPAKARLAKVAAI